MGYAIIDRATARILSWQRWNAPPHDPGTQHVVASEEPPDFETQRWDGADGLRQETTQELADRQSEQRATERVAAADLLTSATPLARALRALVAEWVMEDRAKYNALIDLLRTRTTLFNATERSHLQSLKLTTDPAEVRQSLADRANSAASD